MDPQFSSCHDLGGSVNQPWSYEACTNILSLADMTRFDLAPPHFQFQAATPQRKPPALPTTQTPTETTTTETTTTESTTTEATTSSTTETTTSETTEIEETTLVPTEASADTPTSESQAEAEVSLVLPQTNFVSMTGPLQPVKPAPALRPSSEPTFDPLDFQPVSDQGDIQRSHWSSSYITPLSLVQSSRVSKYFHALKGIFPAPRWFFMA